MRETVAKYCEKFINLEIVALAFLLPLFFIPVTVEFFEFNKLILLSVATILGILAWGLKSALTGNFGIRHSPFDLPVLAFFLVTVISTIFSDTRLLSVIGQYARWLPSLFSVSVLTALYFLISWNLKEKTLRSSIWALLSSAAIVAVLFWVRYFGVNLFGQAWSNQITFTPLGSPTVLALFLGAISGIAIRDMLAEEKLWKKIALLKLFLILSFTLAPINAIVGWVALGASTLTGLLTSPTILLGKNKIFLPLAIALPIVFAALVLVPPALGKSTFLNKDFPSEITLDLETSWSISATSFRQKPLWGSGPSTFLSDFTRYKPLRFNQTDLWTIRFDKPLNEYLLTFAEEGLLGVLVWIILIIIFVQNLLRNKDWKLLPVGIALLAGYLFTNATVVSSFLLFLTLASAKPKVEEELSQIGGLALGRSRTKEIVTFVLIMIFSILTIAWIYRAYAAEVLQREARNTQDITQAYNFQEQSIAQFSWEANNHLALAQTSFLLANQIAGTANPSQQDQDNIKTLIAQSINEAKEATNLDPLNAGNWEGLAQIYRSLIGLAKDAETWATDSYQKAIGLDMFNPLLRIGLGGLYYQLGQFSTAAGQFSAATNLKPDYANGHYNLGRAYKEMGNKTLAIQELETALQLSNPSVQGYTEAKQVLDELQKSSKSK